MTRYIVRRLFLVILTLFLTSVVVFSVITLVPGDVATVILGQWATPDAVASLREALGLNRPALVRYVIWIEGFVVGDWGISLSTKYPVLPMVLERLVASLKLAAVALGMSVPVSVALGVSAGLKKQSVVDNLISIATLAFTGVPEFVTGMVLVFVFAGWLKWFPAMAGPPEEGAGPLQTLHDLFLPALAVSLVFSAHIVRMTRASVIEVLRTAYVRSATLKGLPRAQVIFRHVLRNALIPTVTIIAMSMPWLIGGLIVVESVFAYPGLGRLLVFGIKHRDVPLIEAVSMLMAMTISLANFAADLFSAFLNPRIRLG